MNLRIYRDTRVSRDKFLLHTNTNKHKKKTKFTNSNFKPQITYIMCLKTRRSRSGCLSSTTTTLQRALKWMMKRTTPRWLPSSKKTCPSQSYHRARRKNIGRILGSNYIEGGGGVIETEPPLSLVS